MNKRCPKTDPLRQWLQYGWRRYNPDKPQTGPFVVIYEKETALDFPHHGHNRTFNDFAEYSHYMSTFFPLPHDCWAGLNRHRHDPVVLFKDYTPHD